MLGLIGYQQIMCYGRYNGFCEIDGERFEITEVPGSVEHVYARL